MAELSVDNVLEYTNGRLEDNDETARMLSAALRAARREVGWHVSPVRTEEITLDGPNSRMLYLPTQKVVALTAVTEDGVELDLDDIAISAGNRPERPRPVALRKRSRGWWTGEYGGVVVEMSHGFTEAQAADWRQAVLSMVDQMSLVPVSAGTGVSALAQRGWKVDDVSVSYAPYSTLAEEVLFSVSHVMCDYKLPTVEFM